MKTNVWEALRSGNVNSSPPACREQALELGAFLLLIVPSMALSFFATKPSSLSFTLSAIASILRDLSLVGLILFFLWRNREPVRLIGWNFTKLWREFLLGLILFFPLFYLSGQVEDALHALGLSVPSTTPAYLSPKGFAEIVLASFLVLVVAIAEETIFRGYLILRFKALTNNAVAVVLSAVVFSIGHGYEGTAGLVTVGLMGLIFAIIFQWRRSLVAPMVMHFLQDFAVIVLPPLLAMIR